MLKKVDNHLKIGEISLQNTGVSKMQRHSVNVCTPTKTQDFCNSISFKAFITVDDVTSSSINVTVTEVPEATSYQLVLRDPSGAEMVVDITPEDFMNGEFPSAFENLDPETDYEIVLRYTNAAGETQEAETVMARTTGISLHKLACSSYALDFLQIIVIKLKNTYDSILI